MGEGAGGEGGEETELWTALMLNLAASCVKLGEVNIFSNVSILALPSRVNIPGH